MLGRGSVAVALVLSAVPTSAHAATRLVGPGHPYATPCQAIAAAAPGDTVRIDAAGNGRYDGDVRASGVPDLTIEGFNGRARIDAAGRSSGGKAIWVLSGPDTLVRNVELSGAAVPDRNGAADTDVVVERSEFARNGAGDGQSHNIYVARAHRFTMRFSYSHDARVGHFVKTRALVNEISYNRLTGEDNTFVNDRPGSATAILVGPSATAPVDVVNNLVVGTTTLVDQDAARLAANCVTRRPHFADRADFDYRLRPASACRDAGVRHVPGGLPSAQYVYDLRRAPRRVLGGAPDAGAFESRTRRAPQ